MTKDHTGQVLQMIRSFYASPAVSINGSQEIFRCDIQNCIGGSRYLEGYVFTEDGAVVAYAMVAKSFSTEFGRPCIWVEDLYLMPLYRGKGIAARSFSFLEGKYPDAVFRLEVEGDNEYALRAYRKSGFGVLTYIEMKE